jgi:hypothetical protein
MMDSVVHLLKARQEARQGSGTDSHMASHLDVAPSQFTGHDTKPFFRRRLFHPQKIVGQQIAKAAVDFAEAVRRECTATFEATAVDPFLDDDVSLGFELQISLASILAVIVLEGPLDIDGVRIVPLDEIGVVAVHRPHQAGKRREQTRRHAATEPGGLLR